MRSFDRDNCYKCPTPPLRVNDELRHNPYVGSFHGISRLSEDAKNKSLSIHNPHLGTFRHSPAAACAFPVKLNMGFKGLLYDDQPFQSKVLSQVQIACGRNSGLRLTPHFLQTMPSFKFSLQESESEDLGVEDVNSTPTCAICLEAFTDGCELRSLACHHCFHKKCVDMWLCGQHSDESQCTAICPTCRQDAIITPKPPQRREHRAFSDAATPILLSKPTSQDNLSLDSEGCQEINDIIHSIIDGNGPTSSLLLSAGNASESSRRGASSPDGNRMIQTPPPTPDLEFTGSVTSSDIPDTAFANVGRFLYSGFSTVLPESVKDGTSLRFDAEALDGIYSAIPEVEDDCLLGSTYDLCGVDPK